MLTILFLVVLKRPVWGRHLAATFMIDTEEEIAAVVKSGAWIEVNDGEAVS